MRRSRRSTLGAVTLGSVTLVSLLAGVAVTAGYTSVGATLEPDHPDKVVTTEKSLNYVSYAPSYRNLPVFVGGDVVVLTGRAGKVRSSTSGLVPISAPTDPKIGAAKAKTF